MTALSDPLSASDWNAKEQDPLHGGRQSSARRAIAACAGAALYMAALGIWLVPAEDSATQLIKLVASCIMMGIGAFLFHGVSSGRQDPEVQVDLIKRQLRVYEYDTKGRSVMTACHAMDDLQELSLRKDRLLARDASGDLMMDVEIGTEEGEAILSALRSQSA